MDEQQLRIFNAISSFIQDLDVGFGKKYKPVALYNRLISKTTFRDSVAVSRHIKAFESFFNANNGYVVTKRLAEEARVKYSDRVYLDIGRILSKIDDDSHKQIHQHLITIYTLMNIGTEKGKQALETLKEESKEPEKVGIEGLNLPDTTEGKFIKDTFGEMMSHYNSTNTENMNPMSMISGMMSSGFFTKFMGTLQEDFSSGKMDMKKLMSTVTSVISEASPEGSEEIKNMVTQMSGLAGLSGNENPELQGQVNEFLNAIGGNEPKIEEIAEEKKDTKSNVSESEDEN